MKFGDVLTKEIGHILVGGHIPMLIGEPGIGKSSSVNALAKLNHTQCFTLACNQLADKSDLTGARLVPYEKQIKQTDGSIVTEQDYKQVFYPHETITECVNYAINNPRETPILFLDEINRTGADVTSALLSIATDRKVGKTKLPDNVWVVVAGNDKGNIITLDSASITRFVRLHTDPDASTFLSIHNDLHPCVANAIKNHPETILCKTLSRAAIGSSSDDDDENSDDIFEDVIDDSDEMRQWSCPRTIKSLSDFLNQHTQDELAQLFAMQTIIEGEESTVLTELIYAHTGRTDFSEYVNAEIADSIMNSSIQTNNAFMVGKPPVYDTMKACGDITSLQQCIAGMTNEELSGCIVYALHEPADNATIINELAPKVQQILPNDMGTLMQCFSNGKLDAENVQTFLSTNTTIAMSLSAVLSSIV